MIQKAFGQATVRARIGEGVTAFTRIEDGARAVAVGDVVRLAVRPALMGTALHFIVHQACARRLCIDSTQPPSLCVCPVSSINTTNANVKVIC